MNFGAIIHRTSDNFCYPLDKDTIQITLKTGYDVEKVSIIHGDPFLGGILGGDWKWSGQKVEITEKVELDYHIVWKIKVKPEYKRLKYYFELVSKDETVYFYEDGFFYEEKKYNEQSFIKPWLNPTDVKEIPEWVNNTIWYQIFPDRFFNGDSSINPTGTLKWASKKPKNEDIYGGDLRGIIKKLDYLKDLGINGIYLTPIFKASSIHKYDTIDYYEIDEIFGDKETFKELVQKAHDKGIKIMLDGVFNHCGKEFPYWQDVLKNGEKSKYFNWFMVNKWPIDENKKGTEDKSFYSFAFTSNMPKLNTNNQEVVDYILDICEYWIKEFDIDGWRLDVANEISHYLCKEIRKRVKSIKPNVYILGEIWHDAIEWLRGDEFDSVMNYPLQTTITSFWNNKNMTNVEFMYKVNRCYNVYMEQTNKVLFNLLDSHDTDRLIHRTKDEDIFWQQLAILFTLVGSPCIFYGTEIVLEGAHDPDCRACMPWDKIEQGIYDEKIEKMKKLIDLRKNTEAFKNNNIKFINDSHNTRLIKYCKEDDKQKIIVTINASDKEVKVHYKEVIFSNLLNESTLQPKGVLIERIEK
ncbi:glycoside hydrolase family 13 protein [uncultured Tyzzerella sp.]|uniref:glycoside hydrolase family 13 protein n=1 Tax=uncultured Tyzzerella sp. TaxID=2321398 RepID=UPI0029431903|nr:glycoside hydrolase family 13 protein [uncultured Tyzzerella sp.]